MSCTIQTNNTILDIVYQSLTANTLLGFRKQCYVIQYLASSQNITEIHNMTDFKHWKTSCINSQKKNWTFHHLIHIVQNNTVLIPYKLQSRHILYTNQIRRNRLDFNWESVKNHVCGDQKDNRSLFLSLPLQQPYSNDDKTIFTYNQRGSYEVEIKQNN